MTYKIDFLVIGSGIGGLSFALKAAEYGQVLIITKSELTETNTRYAQGGIASVTYTPDDFSKHINDTLISGDGICNKEVVEMVVKNAPAAINDLIKWGVNFDKSLNGDYSLGREGGHSENRILHYKDKTGEEIQQVLSAKAKKNKNIKILEYHFAIDLITQHQLGKLVKRGNTDTECYGTYALDLITNEIHTILSKITCLSTGGTGNIYQTTTNPSIATGDGIAMMYRAKGNVENMEFYQFHPTSLYNPGDRPQFLITEAMRGAGAILKTKDGKEFMEKYDPRGCLAPRDIVARAIDHEMKTHGDDFVYLDCRHIEKEELLNHFPTIYKKCKTINIDITKQMIPVVPAAHYQCGGISVNMNGESTIHHLYAIGEVACTGLHGANRLASNSLLEAIVFADKAVADAKNKINNIQINNLIPIWNSEGTSKPKEMVMITYNIMEIRIIMSNYLGIVRTEERLNRALARLEIIYKETEELFQKSLLSRQLCELRNMINVSYLIIKMALERKESRGLHYMIDYPEKKNIN